MPSNSPFMKTVNREFVYLLFYIITNTCADILLKNIFFVNYQIDIMISRINTTTSQMLIYNIPNCGLEQDKTYSSDVQYYFIKKEDLKLLPFSNDILDIIYDYLPNKNNLENNNENWNLNINWNINWNTDTTDWNTTTTTTTAATTATTEQENNSLYNETLNNLYDNYEDNQII